MYSSDNNFELQIRPRGRSAADEYCHNGAVFIEGREGSNYTLWFNNRSHSRVMAIFSVDGLDTCKGQPAGPNSDGYLVDAHSSIEIPGWKLDSQSAAEFYFSGIGKSYANASGANTNNVGVIGAMVFREQPQFGMYNAFYDQGWASAGMMQPIRGMGYSGTQMGNSLSSSIGMNSVQVCASGTSQSVGTGFGNSTQFKTAEVPFIRANPSVPDALLVIYYNSANNLRKMGIQLRTRSTRYDNSSAQAFPGYTTGCTPPPGWTK